jgi:hypothetical protein
MVGKDVEMTIIIEEVSKEQQEIELQEFLDVAKNPPMDLDILERIVNEMREISKT